MCGIFASVHFEREWSKFSLPVIHELSMRGKHNLGEYLSGDQSVRLVHSRYSTSDILYPQPIESPVGVIIHNGVITQQDPEFWVTERFTTKNDSEILLHTLDDHREHFQHDLYSNYPLCSYAFAYYRKNSGKLLFGRNGKRPLYYQINNDSLVVTSTKSIFERAGINISTIHKCQNDVVYICNPNGGSIGLEITPMFPQSLEDLQ